MKAKITIDWDSETGDYDVEYSGDINVPRATLEALLRHIATEVDQWKKKEEKDLEGKRPPWLS